MAGSKKRGGLSARELRASQAGGSLNYNTGAINKPKPRLSLASPTPGVRPAQPPMSSSNDPIGQNRDGSYIYANGVNRPQVSSSAGSIPASSISNPNVQNYQPQFSSPEKASDRSSSKRGTRSSSQGTSPIKSIFQKATSSLSDAAKDYTDAVGTAAQTRSSLVVPSINGLNEAGAAVAGSFAAPRAANASSLIPMSSAIDPSAANYQPTPDSIGMPNETPDDEYQDVWATSADSEDSIGNDAGEAGFFRSGGNTTVNADGSKRSSKNNDDNGNNPYDQYATLLKAAKKQQEEAFADMLEQIDPTYDGYQQDFEQSLSEAQNQERSQLLGRQMAYGTADSEQRDQAEARLTNEFAGKRSTFMQRLAERENGSRAQLGLQRANSLSAMDMKQAETALDSYKYQKSLEQQEFENELNTYKARSSSSNSGNARQNKISAWMDRAKQDAANSRDTSFKREGIARRAAQMFGGSPADYTMYLQDGWEADYSLSPRFVPDGMGGGVWESATYTPE